MPVPRRLLSTGGSNRAKEWLKHRLSFRFLVWEGDFPEGPSPGLPCLLPSFYFTCPAVRSPTCSQNLLNERRVLQVTPVRTTLSLALGWPSSWLLPAWLPPPTPYSSSFPSCASLRLLIRPQAQSARPCRPGPYSPRPGALSTRCWCPSCCRRAPRRDAPLGPGGWEGRHLCAWPGCLALQQVWSSQQAPFPGC